MGIETPELQEQLEKAIERAEEDVIEKAAPRWLFQLSLSTALVAVLAAVASLKAERLSNQALLFKNEAILYQAKASDAWSYYQAKSIKRAIYDTRGNKAEVAHYEKDEATIKASAEDLEKKVKDYDEQSDDLFEGHHDFSLAVMLFQVTIALSAIASLTRQKLLWGFGLLVSAGGLVILIRGWL